MFEMRVARSFNRKIPTEIEYQQHLKKCTYILPEEWRCPVCDRNQRELMRWKKTKWSSNFHIHHDHGNRWQTKILICSDCNAADGLTKRLHKLPKQWSFSVEELKEFVRCEPNGTIESIDLDIAQEIFQEWITYHSL
jgi:hypothetical protein